MSAKADAEGEFMNRSISWEDRVRGAYASLRPSEQKVAEYLLTHAQEAASLTIGQLAQEAGVSEPTVIRCVRALGFSGYRAFKQALLQKDPPRRQQETAFDPLGGFALQPWERIADLPLKATQIQRESLEETLKSVVPDALEQAVQALHGARLIDIYGVENSCTPAGDLQTKLTYLGLACRMNTDPYLQQIGAVHLTEADVAVAFSHSGRSADTVKALKLAKKAGARTIGISSQRDSRLAKYADIYLCMGGSANAIYGNAIFSRVPDLAVVDMLYMGVILSDYERFSQSLDRSGTVIADRGLLDK